MDDSGELRVVVDRSETLGEARIDVIDTGPGIDAEERGQAEAIARSTEKCLKVGVPLVSVVIGEGGSGEKRRRRI